MSDPQPTINVAGGRKFQNQHHTVEQQVRRKVDVWNAKVDGPQLPVYRGTTAGLQGLVAESVNRGEEIRAYGAAWSFSGAPATSGTLINTKPLNLKFPIAKSAVRAGYAEEYDDLYFVQAGASIHDLNEFLFDRKKSLPTSGASNGQTIAGAFSTGTHGSAIDFGAIPEFVRAIHLIVSHKKHVWIEPTRNPVLLPSGVPKKLGAEVILDDQLFDAALVSFGSFGIIHGAVIEATDQYILKVARRKLKRTAYERVMQDLDFSSVKEPWLDGRPFHFSTVINPFDAGNVYVTVMHKHATMPAGCSRPDPPSRVRLGDDALGIVSTLTEIAEDVTPHVLEYFLGTEYPDIQNVAGTPGQIFPRSTTRGSVTSTAIGVEVSRVNDVIELILNVHERIPAPVIIGVRYVTPTRATLGFTRFSGHTAIVEVDGPQTDRVQDMQERFWGELRSAEIPHTFHWGKMHDLTAPRLRHAYENERVDTWIRSRNKLLTSKTLRDAFANSMVRGVGLNP